jgi:diketogulonate reductase-like aldo/keto reductase
MEVFAFELSEDDMETITGLNRDYRTGVDPNDRN